MSDISHVPTNIITGALGVGKTTLIQSLLKQKPEDERWAILVNEFGEVGIDGAIMSGRNQQDVFIKEVPGGCMCCTSGLPMQIALNLLLAQAKPDRLLIEPTGLGHPKEVLQTLSAEHYQDVLDIHATLTLLDARKLNDEHWRAHPTFQEQMQIADVIVLTKSDLYSDNYQPALSAYMEDAGVSQTPVIVADNGHIPLSHLARPISEESTSHSDHHHHHHHHESDNSNVLSTPPSGVVSVRNQGEGYHSRGWICAKDKHFDFATCDRVFRSLPVERLKAVLITEQGPFSFNVSTDAVDVTALHSADDSRIVFIVNNEAAADRLAQTLTDALTLVD